MRACVRACVYVYSRMFTRKEHVLGVLIDLRRERERERERENVLTTLRETERGGGEGRERE